MSLEKAHFIRCERKRAFPHASIATRAAMEMSRKEGELLIANECIDCGNWHVGHADEAQQGARRPIEQVFCARCGGFISELRWRNLKEHSDGETWTRSPQCTRSLAAKRKKARRKNSN